MGSTDETILITGPDPTLELIYSDTWLPGLYSRRILCFELPESSTHGRVIDVVQRALRALVQGTPELGADSIVVSAPHDPSLPWRALGKGDGIRLVIKNMTETFQSYKELARAGFPLSWLKDSLFMPVPGPITPEPLPQAVFQLSLIKGGALLSVCIYHHLTDGNGMNTITRALGQECQKAAEIEGDLPPCVLDVDRTVMKNLRGGKTDLEEHPAYEYSPGIFTPGVHHEEEAPVETTGQAAPPPPPPPKFTPGYFHLSHPKAQALKDYASRDAPVSTHDAIIALLWRTTILARVRAGHLKDDDTAVLTFPHDSRRHVGLPKTWVGNCVYFLVVQVPVAEVLQPDSVPVLATKIRAELNKVNRDVVEGLMTLRRQDPYGLSWWPFMKINDANVVGGTSMYHSEIMGCDWGAALGEVKHFTATELGAFPVGLQRGHFVGPKLPGGRGCNVHVGLVNEEVETFSNDPVWNEYFRLLEVREDLKGRVDA